VDEAAFARRGAHGVAGSRYRFAMTACRERVGVIDDELDDFYFDAEKASRSVSLLGDAECSFCEATTSSLHRLDELEQVPERRRWACDGKPRPGSRRG
jgi:hypothetical protein